MADMSDQQYRDIVDYNWGPAIPAKQSLFGFVVAPCQNEHTK